MQSDQTFFQAINKTHTTTTTTTSSTSLQFFIPSAVRDDDQDKKAGLQLLNNDWKNVSDYNNTALFDGQQSTSDGRRCQLLLLRPLLDQR